VGDISLSLRRKAEVREARRRSSLTIDVQRAAFLRSCRARIKPGEVNLPSNPRARVQGLRREDVAALSGVSASWYTWLEQGRRMRVSDEILDRLAQALRLSEDERAYLYSLVQQRPPRVEGSTPPEVPPDVELLIRSMNLPAIVLSLQLDVLAWNAQQAAIYRDYDKIPVEERNIALIMFTKPATHMTPTQFEETASRTVARLHYDYSRSADKERFDVLVRRLCNHSPLFRRLWHVPEFNLRAFGLHRFTHPRFGPVSLEHTSFSPDGHPDVRVAVCAPADDSTCLALATINAELCKVGTFSSG
jgi:transcriptional regulator with XRE-family HTH domain